MSIQNELYLSDPARDLLSDVKGKFKTILADPPWQFQNRTGKMAPEHKRLLRYPTMNLNEIKELPVSALADDPAHLYLWCPNAMLECGLEVLRSWGFEYKSNIIWCGTEDGRICWFADNTSSAFLFMRDFPSHSNKVTFIF